MYKLKPKKEIPEEITNLETGEKVSRDVLLNNFRSVLLVFYRGVFFENKVPIVSMYPEAWEEI